MIKSSLVNSESGKELQTCEGYTDNSVLVTTTHGAQYGSFVAATRSAAGTTAVIAAQGDDAIVLTDLILTTDKVNATTATVNITDGSNTVKLIAADLTDAPCNIAISFAGHWQTWKACRVDLVTVGVVTATLALGYFRIPWDTAMGFGEWDALR